MWNRALTNEDLTRAYERGKAGNTCFPAALLPKPKRRLTEGLDLASRSQERPTLPKQVEWGSDGAVVEETETRHSVCLNGYWRFQTTSGRFIAPSPDGWGYARLPGWVAAERRVRAPRVYDGNFKVLKKHNWNGRSIADHDMFWYERDIEVPASHAGRRFFLRFERVDDALPFVDVYLNGRYVRRLRTYGPGHLDVTDWIEAGKSNRITLGVEGKVRLLFDWYLDARKLKAVSAHDLYIISEWRKKSVTVRADLENHTGAEQTFSYSADFFEWDSGKKVHSIPGRSIKLAPSTRQTVEISGEWRDPREWSIYDPFLHTAQLVIRDAKGAVVDRSLKVRFGYRELWSEKGWLHCNGSKLHNRGIGQSCGIMGYHVPVSYADMFNHAMAFMAYHKSVNTFWKRTINRHGADAIHDAGDRTGFFTTFRQSGTGFTADRLWSGNREGQLRDRAFARWLRNHPSLSSYIMRQSGNYEQKEGIGGGGAETRNWRDKFLEDASWIPYRRAWDQFVAPTKQEHPSALFMGMWLPYGDQIGHRLGKHGYGYPLQAREEEPRFHAFKGMSFHNSEMGWPQISRNGFDATGVDDLKKHYKVYWPNLTQFNEAFSAMYLGDEAYDQEAEVRAGLATHYKVADGDVARFSWNYVKGVETIGRPFTRRTRFHSSPALFKLRKLFTRRMIQAWRWCGYGYWEHTETSHYLQTTPPHVAGKDTTDIHTEDYFGLRGPGLFVDDGRRTAVQKVCGDPAKLRSMVTHSKIGELVKKAQSPLVAWIYGHPDISNKNHSWYAGETIRKQIGVINEYPQPIEAAIKWQVKRENGDEIAAGELVASFQTGHQQLHPISFKAPNVTEKNRYLIEIETSLNGMIVHDDQFPFQVFPPHKTAGISGSIGLIDSQATGAMLRIAGVSYSPVNETSDLSKLDLLIIGRQCKQAQVRDLLKKLDINKHLTAGLNVLVFEQEGQVLNRPTPDPWPRLTLKDRPDRPEMVSFGLRLEHTSSRYTFIRDREHPIFKGLSNEDLANWRDASNLLPPWTRPAWMGNNRVGTRSWRETQASNLGEIATFVFDKPHGGNFVSLADASFDTVYSALLEERRAKGRTIYCQLNVTNRYLADPVATLIVDRLLAYAVKRADGPSGKAAFMGGDQWMPALEHLPFDLQSLGNQQLKNFDLLVTGIGQPHIDTYNEKNELIGTKAAPADEKDVSLMWLKKNRTAITEFVKAGGSVLTLPVSAETDLSWLPFKASLKTEKIFAVKQNNFFKTCRAIGPADLYWHRALELSVLTNLPQGSTATTPALLARVPYGKGEFIFCQVHPKSVYGNWPETKLTRLLSAILTEKGIADQHNLDLTVHGYQKGGFPYIGTTLYFDPFLSTAW